MSENKTTAQEILEEIENEEGLTPEVEEPKEEQTQEPEQEEVQEDQPSEAVITEELVKEYGLSKHLVGKPIKELANSYAQMIKQDTKLSQELKQLKETVESLKAEATRSEQKAATQQTIAELGEMPDPVEDPEDYKKWMKQLTTNLKAELRAEILKEIGPGLQRANELSTKDMINETIDMIQAGLPKGVNADDVLAEFIDENKDHFEELVKAGKKRSPEELAKEALKDYKAKAYDKQTKLTEEEIVKRASEIAQTQLKKKVGSVKVSDINTNSRETKTKGLAADIVRDLEAEKE